MGKIIQQQKIRLTELTTLIFNLKTMNINKITINAKSTKSQLKVNRHRSKETTVNYCNNQVDFRLTLNSLRTSESTISTVSTEKTNRLTAYNFL
jgi:aspartate carbamoyltransferase regulatory subunit